MTKPTSQPGQKLALAEAAHNNAIGGDAASYLLVHQALHMLDGLFNALRVHRLPFHHVLKAVLVQMVDVKPPCTARGAKD